MRLASLTVLALFACADGTKDATEAPADTDTDTDTDTDADTDTDTDADTDTDTDADTDTDTDTDADSADTASTDTGTTDTGTVDTGTPSTGGFAAPTLLEVSCTATANALRYTCDVTVDPPQPVELSFVRADGLSVTRTAESDAAAADHELPVYFLAAQQDYDVVAWARDWPATTATTTLTTALPPTAVASYLEVTGVSASDLMGTHLPCSDDPYAVIYDTVTGDLVWYQELVGNGTLGLNNMVSFTEDHTVLGESDGTVVEVDLMGTDLVRLVDLHTTFGVTATGIFGNFHHDIMKRNGVYYVIYQEVFSAGFFGDVLDNLILFDAAGTQLAHWRALDQLPVPANWSGDYLHANTVSVDADGDIYVSWLTRNTVAKLDGDYLGATFGEPLWYLTGSDNNPFGGNELAIDWNAVGGADSFRDQHSVVARDDGKLQLLDNANGRGLVFALDEVALTATAEAEHPTRESSCGPQGTARTSADGHAVVGCTGEWVREYDLAGSMVWEAEAICPGGGFFVPGASRWYPLDDW